VAGLVLAAVLALAGGPTAAPLAVLLFGVAAAPVYPLLTLTTAARTSAAVADTVVGYQAAASSLGAAIFPLLVGLAVERSGSGFGQALLVLCGLATGLQLVIQLRHRRQGRQSRA
jgi:hypothetical protein